MRSECAESNVTLVTLVMAGVPYIPLLMWDRVRILFYGVPVSEMVSALPSAWRTAGNATAQQTITPEDLSAAKLPPYTLLAVPGFVLLCAVELLVGLCRGRKLYRANDGVVSLMLGLVMLLTSFVTGAVGLGLYCHIWSNYGFQNAVPIDSPWHWAGLLVGCDFGYYWFHRTAHEYHLSWSAHSVHHSGEDYNLATALRQGAVQQLTSWPFKLALALVFHPALYVMHSALNTLGQFWIHTQVIGSCGPLEYVLNTPSHHRMHHRPPGNCNYAGILIVWDRMFGTFKAEDSQQDYYGLAKQYKTFDPLWANFEHPRRVLEAARRTASKAPGGASALTVATEFVRRCFRKRVHHAAVFQPRALFRNIREEHADTAPAASLWRLPRGKSKRHRLESNAFGSHFLVVAHVVQHFVVTLLAAVGLMLKHGDLPSRAHALIGCSYLILSCASLGRLFDGGRFGIALETARLVVFAAAVLKVVGVESQSESHDASQWIPQYMRSKLPTIAAAQLGMWMMTAAIASSRAKVPAAQHSAKEE